MPQIYVIKSNGEKELFDPSKLRGSLERSGAKKELAERIVSHMQTEIKDGTSTREIYKHAFFLLHKMERPVAARYSLRRALTDLGPTGFPFEDFIAELFKAKGYEVETDKTIRGKCIEHEIDVIAYNEDKLIMTEAKFHNDLTIKTDVKVILYIKSRFDDLHKTTFNNYGREGRKLDEGWLVTNTKFTETAIQYGKCENVKMIGWNYPQKGNLHDMIEDAGLHPITCLTALTRAEKMLLLNKGIVLCKYLKDNRDILRSVGVKDDKIAEVIKEINLLGPQF